MTDQRETVRWFVLNAEATVEVDITGLDALDDLRRSLTERGVVFAMARVKQDLRTQLDAYGLTAAVGPEYLFPTLPTALAAYEQWRHADPAQLRWFQALRHTATGRSGPNEQAFRHAGAVKVPQSYAELSRERWVLRRGKASWSFGYWVASRSRTRVRHSPWVDRDIDGYSRCCC